MSLLSSGRSGAAVEFELLIAAKKERVRDCVVDLLRAWISPGLHLYDRFRKSLVEAPEIVRHSLSLLKRALNSESEEDNTSRDLGEPVSGEESADHVHHKAKAILMLAVEERMSLMYMQSTMDIRATCGQQRSAVAPFLRFNKSAVIADV